MAVQQALKVHKAYPKPCCPVCDRVLKPPEMKSGRIFCKRCGNTFEATFFSPPPEVVTVRNIGGLEAGVEGAPGGKAPCAKHVLNEADTNCERCGNFMCPLCRIDIDGKAYCPACFERVLEKGAEGLAPVREPYARGLAGYAAFFGLLPPLGLAMGPMTIAYALRALKQVRAGTKSTGSVGGIVLLILWGVGDLLLTVAAVWFVLYWAMNWR